MIGSKQLYNDLKEKDLQLHIELGDGGTYSTKRIGIVTFKRESSSHLHRKNVMYVSRLKKKLIYVVLWEDRGYDVVFIKGKCFLKHVATGKLK